MADDERSSDGYWYFEEPGEPLTPDEIAALTPEDIEDVPPEDVIDLDGEIFIRRYGPAAEVTIFEDDTPLPGRIIVPADPSETSTEEVERLAVELYRDIRALEKQFSDEYIAGLVTTLEEDYFRALADQVITYLREGLRLMVDPNGETPEGQEELDLEPDEIEPVEQRTNELLHDELGRLVYDVFLEGEAAPHYKTEITRSILVHAHAWAVADARDAVARSGRSLDDLTDDEFETEVNTLFQAGTYVTRAMLTSFEHTFQSMVHTVTQSLEENPGFPRKLGRLARDELRGLLKPRSELPTAPGFVDGYGMVAADDVVAGLRASLAGAADGVGWLPGPSGHPYFPHAATNMTYSLEEAAYATASAAFDEVQRLGDREADVYDAICATWARNAKGEGDFVTFSLDEACTTLGYQKHHKGGHRREHRDEVRTRIVRLGRLRVHSPAFAVWEETLEPKGKPRRVQRTYRIEDEPVLHLGASLAQVEFDGGSHRVSIRVRPGETVARSLRGPVGQQYALMSEKLLGLDGRNAIYPKRLGRYFTRLWRIRATKTAYDAGVMVRTMLQGAAVQIPERNRDRFRDRIEAALDELHAQEIIGGWHYVGDAPPATGRGWAEQWLEAKVCVAPPMSLRTAYQNIHGKGRRRPGALTSPPPAVHNPPTGGSDSRLDPALKRLTSLTARGGPLSGPPRVR